MKWSEQRDEINKAFALARGEFLKIDKGRTADTGKFTYDFADLADVYEATTPALSKHGLTILADAWTQLEPLACMVQTTITHASGQWCESTPMAIPVAPDGKMGPAQLLGSAETYGRRYQALAMLGVQPKGEDDDGHAASGTDAKTEQRKEREPLPECLVCKTNKHVIIGKPEFGGGFVCYKAKGGCGAKWQAAAAVPANGEEPHAPAPEPQSQVGSGKKSREESRDWPLLKEELVKIGCTPGHPEEAEAVIKFLIGDATLIGCRNDSKAARDVLDMLDAQLTLNKIPAAELLHDALVQAGLKKAEPAAV